MNVKTPYELLGSAEGVRRLVDRFYDLMQTRPEAQTIRALHHDDLTTARDKLYKFLSGWLGGPALYTEEYGHPRLRARHLPFAIDEAARDAWMLCMTTALEDFPLDDLARQQLLSALYRTADHMRNR